MAPPAAPRTFGLLAVLASLFALLVHAQSFDPNKAAPQYWDPANVGTNTSTNATYSNPVFTKNVGDPWITKYTIDGQLWYLFTCSTNDNITIWRSKALTDNWDNAESRAVFTPDQSKGDPWSTSIWAPEVHSINGSWYIIFTATPDFDNPPPLQDAQCPVNCPAINHVLVPCPLFLVPHHTFQMQCV